jgi:hypothetical protein
MQIFDHRAVGHADPEGQPAAADCLRRGRLLSQGQGMARIGGYDAHPELYPVRLTARYGQDAQRIDAA